MSQPERDFAAEWAERERQRVIDAERQIAELFPVLEHHGLTSVEVIWYGSGDEGGIDQIHPFRGTELVGDLPNEVIQTIDEAIFEALGSRYGAWYDNEGGSGQAQIDVVGGTLALNHGWGGEITFSQERTLIGRDGKMIARFERSIPGEELGVWLVKEGEPYRLPERELIEGWLADIRTIVGRLNALRMSAQTPRFGSALISEALAAALRDTESLESFLIGSQRNEEINEQEAQHERD